MSQRIQVHGNLPPAFQLRPGRLVAPGPPPPAAPPAEDRAKELFVNLQRICAEGIQANMSVRDIALHASRKFNTNDRRLAEFVVVMCDKMRNAAADAWFVDFVRCVTAVIDDWALGYRVETPPGWHLDEVLDYTMRQMDPQVQRLAAIEQILDDCARTGDILELPGFDPVDALIDDISGSLE